MTTICSVLCRVLPGLLMVLTRPCFGQSAGTGFVETFDDATPPGLPPGWSTSAGRFPSGGDFRVTDRGAHSGRGAVCAEDATVEQWLITPPFHLRGRLPTHLSFFLRMSASFAAPVVVELSMDCGVSYTVPLGDTLFPGGSPDYVRHRLPIPSLAAETNAVLFRWKIIPAPSGRRGSLRIDSVLVETVDSIDGAVTSLSCVPAMARNQVRIQCVVRNAGYRSLPAGTLVFSVRGPAGTAGSLGLAHLHPGLQPGDSVTIVHKTPPLGAGVYSLRAALALAGERDTADNTSALTLSVSHPPGSVVLNEILYAPSGDEPEWVEVYNVSQDTVDLAAWGIADRGAASRKRLPGRTILLDPGGFLVVTRDSTALAAAHPSVAKEIVQVSGFPSLNNAGDDIVLSDAGGNVMDSVSYTPSWGGENGRSLERIVAGGPSNEPSNWGTSRSACGSTPGWRNSRSRKRVDLSVDSVAVMYRQEGMVTLIVVVCNPGLSGSPQFSLQVYGPQAGPPDAPLAALPWMEGPDTLQCSVMALDIPVQDRDPVTYTVVLVAAEDEDTTNNVSHIQAGLPFARGVIRFNEIMFAPLSGLGEYVELVHAGDAPVALEGWNIVRDPGGGTERTIPLAGGGSAALPGNFVLVSADSTLFHRFPWTASLDRSPVLVVGSRLTLSNNGDVLILTDPTGRTIDSVRYDPDWHTPWMDDHRGRALEKVRPDLPSAAGGNWGTSVRPEGGTPGLPNSITPGAPAGGVLLSVAPTPFSPDGDGRDDMAVVHYELPASGFAVSVTIFDVRGRPVRRLADGEPGETRGDFVWDGLNDERRPARIGIYVVFLEAIDQASGQVRSGKRTVVLARQL